MLNLAKQKLLRPVAIAATLEHQLRAKQKLQESKSVIIEMLNRGYDHWIVTFSGGKDSTSSLIAVLETAIEHPAKIKRIDVVYSDTTIEIPSIHKYAIEFIRTLRKNPRLSGLNLNCHIVRPPIEQRFWVKLLGNGYPPPHQKFRWCTHRLKIFPTEEKLKRFIVPDKTLIVTGVRFGESTDRDRRLLASCSRGGECGQGLWYQHSSRLNAGYLAPLIDWTSCDVWDFLTFLAPLYGYDTSELPKIYNGHDTRFGCWTCTVVKQDRAMERTIEQEEWAHLVPLAEFRKRIWEVTRPRESRIIRKDGNPGKLKLRIRKQLFNELLSIQGAISFSLIRKREIDKIYEIWESNGKKASRKGRSK
jgi:DNA sulfur modification protein DndC